MEEDMKKNILFALITLAFSFVNLFSQNEDMPINLKNRHTISINMGSKADDGSSVSVSLVDVDVQSSFSGSLLYQYWFENEWAIDFQVGFLNAHVETSFYDVSGSSLTAVLVGCRYYPKMLALGNSGRVYGGINFGSYHGSVSYVSDWFSTHVRTEAVFGINPNAGLDLFIGNWLRIGPTVGYHYINKFHHIEIFKDDMSGFEYGFSFGILL
jgi:hypothetical protein